MPFHALPHLHHGEEGESLQYTATCNSSLEVLAEIVRVYSTLDTNDPLCCSIQRCTYAVGI